MNCVVLIKMKISSQLLWIDCTAGAIVGLLILLLLNFFSELYALPVAFTAFIGAVNFGYSIFSFSLARQRRRTLLKLKVLVVANLLWALLCLFYVYLFWAEASIFGIAHLVLEFIFVGGIGIAEWRSRGSLNLAIIS